MMPHPSNQGHGRTLEAPAARTLITALRDATDLPIHLHTHDTSGNGIAMLLSAIESGVDAVDAAMSSMAGLTSQPSLNALLAALGDSDRAPKIDPVRLQSLADYWEAVREMYYPFESGLKASTTEVYTHQIPGGQYTNLKPRAVELGLGHKWSDIKTQYRAVSDALGGLIKVTPSSKVVADFAMFLVQNNLTIDDCLTHGPTLDYPRSVVDFMAGKLGQPYGGFPKALQSAILGPMKPISTRMGGTLEPYDFDAGREKIMAWMQH